MASPDDNEIQTTCQLSFHGAAANSCPHSLLWVCAPAAASDANDGTSSAATTPSTAEETSAERAKLVDTVIYASSGVINLATSYDCLSSAVTSVDATLVTRTLDHASVAAEKKVLARGEAVGDAAAARSVTALAWITNDSFDETRGDGEDDGGDERISDYFGIVAAFSDGTVTSWKYDNSNSSKSSGWNEHVLVGHDPSSTNDDKCQRVNEDGMNAENLQESIADISAVAHREDGNFWMLVATASSKGIFLHLSNETKGVDDEATTSVFSRQIGHHAAASVHFAPSQTPINNGDCDRGAAINHKECYLFAGSASPRHNKVWIYTIPYSTHVNNDAVPLWTIGEPLHHGHLMGHQDWITCFSWLDNEDENNNNHSNGEETKRESLLASSGHDAKIRLWKFSTYLSTTVIREEDDNGDVQELSGSDSDDDEAMIDDLEEEEGEARLVISRPAASSGSGSTVMTTTAVSLEALLLGHEEAVTSLAWRRQRHTKSGGKEKPCLLSASMDRTILLWMEEDGVWVPISRVGSAGGILGGSIGASLMGFVDAAFSPDADRIVGHGYGGSVHFWTQDVPSEAMDTEDPVEDEAEMEEEDAMVSARWVADPCITGHFRTVEDMAWDPNGEYLLTTSADQTTRLWTEVPTMTAAKNKGQSNRWVEVGRPQVHGYDMTSIVCIGGNSNHIDEEGEPCHRFASGADEKVLRVFDAPASTLRMLESIQGLRSTAGPSSGEDSGESQPSSWRVERAFLPSLGLSNKATADTDQESSKFAGPTSNDNETLDVVAGEGDGNNSLQLPSERDLGVTTLWPETRKLFGHESELVCLDAYRPLSVSTGESTLVASSCKARNDVASAAIRLWDSKKGKCVGILKGGHRSTVSTMSFSRDGKYLASSGKDRRICIWKRTKGPMEDTDGSGGYELSAAVDSAHKRIVWSIHFCPKVPDILASGSRDGLIKLWRISEGDDGSLEMKELLRFEPLSKAGKNPITAVAFAEELLKGSGGNKDIDYGILAIGTESGCVEVWAVPVLPNNLEECPSPILLCAIPTNDCHFDTVKKVSWRPSAKGLTGEDQKADKWLDLTLASCGEDNGVRIFNLCIRNISS